MHIPGGDKLAFEWPGDLHRSLRRAGGPEVTRRTLAFNARKFQSMRERDFRRLGLIEPESRELLVKAWQQAGLNRSQWETMLRALSRSPRDFLTDLALGPVARHLSARMGFVPMEERPELAVWPNLSDCSEAGIGMKEARKLPFVVHGAILPGFQIGEGLSVGAVLATRGVVVPRAIGRDIGCRMRLTVLDLPDARARRKDFAPILRDHTRFGLDGVFSRPAPRA